jgi:quercetin dioxygenase-like cupin family protein
VNERPKDRHAARAEVVLPARDLDATLAFFTGLGFALEATFPAEAPVVAVIAGFGVRLRLDAAAEGDPGRVLLHGDGARAGTLVAPNGTRVELCPLAPPVVLPPLAPRFVLSRQSDAAWTVGRAGMRYRDLIPDRLGGRVIASHIRVGDGGDVADYVHYHRVRFQMIFCYRGWTRLLYEDQGPAFVMSAGECVLQPPEIRHRVLACGPGTEVVEIGCPALHETFADPALALPTAGRAPEREFSGQSFTFHDRTTAHWEPSGVPGFAARDLGIAKATRGLAAARILRNEHAASDARRSHDGDLLFSFVTDGAATLVCEGQEPVNVGQGDAFVIPAGVPFALEGRSADLELLEVTMPHEEGPHGA